MGVHHETEIVKRVIILFTSTNYNRRKQKLKGQ